MGEAQLTEVKMMPVQDALLEWIQPPRNIRSDKELGKDALAGVETEFEQGEEK